MTVMTVGWADQARQRLVRTWDSRGGWGYRADDPPYVEPTIYASLALMDQDRSYTDQAGRWLAQIQQEDGAVGLSATLERPAWPTAWCALFWKLNAAFKQPAQRAVHWLLERRGQISRA